MSTTVGLREHFRRLVDFKGREDRASFWPYAATVYGMMTVGTMMVMVPIMRSVVIPADGRPPTMPNMGLFVDAMLVLTLLGVGLFAAAVVRRLHDGGLSGWWGLMPLPFLFYSIYGMQRFFVSFGTGSTDLEGFYPIFFSNMIYIVAIIALIVLLCRRSDPGPNRFDQPIR